LLRRSRFLRSGFLGLLSRFLRSGLLGGCLLHASLFRRSRFLARSLSRLFGSRASRFRRRLGQQVAVLFLALNLGDDYFPLLLVVVVTILGGIPQLLDVVFRDRPPAVLFLL